MAKKIIFKILPFEIKDINEEDRSFWAVGSDETKDRDKDFIHADGWKVGNFLKNPVIPWAHKYSNPPIAQAKAIKIEDGKLMFQPKFPTKEEYEFGHTIYQLYKGGFLRAFSVGFDPIKAKTIVWDDGEGKTSMGTEFIEQELWEISACVVPSNPNALVEAKQAGIIDDAMEKQLLGRWAEIEAMRNLIEDMQRNHEELKREMDRISKPEPDPEPQPVLSTPTKKPVVPVMEMALNKAMITKLIEQIVKTRKENQIETIRREVEKQIKYHLGKIN
jgi:HK97 family phage prohead protease